MEEHLKPSIVRIWNAHRQRIFGVGFLATSQYVVTCAHVVADALNISRNTIEKPAITVEMDFPLLTNHPTSSANILHWDATGDIAVLTFSAQPPPDSQTVPLKPTDSLWEHPFGAYGFPINFDEGVWARGEILGPGDNGWVQINDTQQHGYFVKRGFSGTPVWDVQLNGVVGMVVAADESAQVAFMIPVTQLIQVFPALLVQSAQELVHNVSQRSLSRVAQVKKQALEQQINSLLQQYEAENQRLRTVPPVSAEAERIKTNIAFIFQEMQKVEDELNTLQ